MNIGQAMRYSDEIQQMRPNELEHAYVELRDVNAELLEALEGLMRKFGDFENDPNSRGIGWNPEMIEALHDAENAIAKAKS